MKKAITCLNKRFTVTLAILLLVQFLMLFFAIGLAGGGHGTYIAFPIFYSWLLLPLSLIGEITERAILAKILTVYFFSIPVVLFIFSVTLLFLIKKMVLGKAKLTTILTIYFIGSFFNFIFARSQIQDSFFLASPSFAHLIASIFIVLVLEVLFWSIFFYQLKKVGN